MENIISEESNRHLKDDQVSHSAKKNSGGDELTLFGTCIILGPTTIVQETWSLHMKVMLNYKSLGACEYVSMGVNVS